MGLWLRRLRGAVLMGLTWAIAWGVAGVALAAIGTVAPNAVLDWFFSVFDAPAPALAVPGLVAGMLFSIVLGAAARGRRFGELSIPRFSLLGAAGGALLSVVPAALGALGLATPAAGTSMLRITFTIAGPLILLSAVSAAATLALARKGEARESVPSP